MNTKDMEEKLNIILHCAYKLVEIDQRNQRNKRREVVKQETLHKAKEREDTSPDGIVSENIKNKKQKAFCENYNTDELTGIINKVDIAMSDHNNVRILIFVKAEDGKTYKMCLTCKEKWPKKFIYINFMKPLGITIINENSPLSDYEQFPYKNYEGSRVGFMLNDKGEIKSFTRLIPNLDW